MEPGERFRLKNDPHGNEWFVSENGMMIMDCEDGVARSGVHNVFSAINHGITRRPRLSEEQVKQLKALHKALKGQVADIVQSLRESGVEVDDG